MEKESIVNSQPTKTVVEHSGPAGTEGIILSNFDIANEEETKRKQQQLNENKIESNNASTHDPDANKMVEKTRRRRRSYDYSMDCWPDISRDEVTDCVCATIFCAFYCLCCYNDDD